MKTISQKERILKLLQESPAGILIPIYGKIGAGKFAIIDVDDYEKVNQYRWRQHSFGYAQTGIGKRPNRTTINMHGLIMNPPKGMVVDHIDHNPLNNQKDNLRICTYKQNLQNQLPSKRNKSGAVGVYKRRNRWEAWIKDSSKNHYLGSYLSFEEAKKVRLEAEKHYFNGFALPKRYYA